LGELLLSLGLNVGFEVLLWRMATEPTLWSGVGRYAFQIHVTVLAGGTFGLLVGSLLGLLVGLFLAALSQLLAAPLVIAIDAATKQQLAHRDLGLLWGSFSGFIAAAATMPLAPWAAAFGGIYFMCAGHLHDRHSNECLE